MLKFCKELEESSIILYCPDDNQGSQGKENARNEPPPHVIKSFWGIHINPLEVRMISVSANSDKRSGPFSTGTGYKNIQNTTGS